MKPSVRLTIDIVAMAIFALLARIAHNSEELPLNFVGWLSTLWPFLVGVLLSWALVAWRGWREGITVWLTTAIVGLAIWGIRHAEVPHWSFIVVAGVMSAILLLGWRGLARAFKL